MLATRLGVKEAAILNLRPPTNEGLPIEVLHPAFATFVHDVRSIPPDEWALEDDVNQVSLALCRAMARDFDSERTRRAELVKQLHPLELRLRIEFHIEQTPPLETHSARPDLCISNEDTMERSSPSLKLAIHICKPRAPIKRSYIVWRAKSEHLMESHVSSWWCVVSTRHLKESVEITERLIFRPTSHSGSWYF